MMEETSLPRVLVGAPTGELHEYVIDRYMDCISKLTYKNIELLLVDNSKNTEYIQKLLLKAAALKIEVKIIQTKYKENIYENIADSCNTMLKVAKEGKYDYLLITSTDVLVPPGTIERLMSHKKDVVGFLVHGGTGDAKFPVVLKDGRFVKKGNVGLNYYTWKEIGDFEGKLTKVWATSAACLLITNKVLESNVKFRYTPTMGIGEDVWFFVSVNSAGYEFWLDPVRVEHLNKKWDDRIKITMSNISKERKKTEPTIGDLKARVNRLELLLATLVRRLKENMVIE